MQKQLIASLMGLAVLATSTLPFASTVQASSHREAPFVSEDPCTDSTDFYAFRSPDKQDTVTFIANYIPLEEPVGGPNYYGFCPNVLYTINIDNTGDGEEDIRYEFNFRKNIRNPKTFLYATGPIDSLFDQDYNETTLYSVTKIENGRRQSMASNLIMPPNNIGAKSTPNYASLESQGIYSLPDGSKMYVGQTEDPFFVDLNVFDLLTVRQLPGDIGGGIDSVRGYNTHTIALQIPINQLTKNKQTPTGTTDPNAIIGAYTAAYRKATVTLRGPTLQPVISPIIRPQSPRVCKINPSAAGCELLNNGDEGQINQEFGVDTNVSDRWVQVSRLANPLVNEVIIPLGQKDTWNAVEPTDDKVFRKFFKNPEIAGLLKALYNVQVPPTPRDDIDTIFNLGVPGLNQPANAKIAELMRLNMAVPVATNPNRMGVLGGDIQGYPNGRRLADDTVDISFRAMAGAVYGVFHPGFTPDPLASRLGDGVDANEKPFRDSFPYMALAHSGTNSVPHSQNTLADAFNQMKNTTAANTVAYGINKLFSYIF